MKRIAQILIVVSMAFTFSACTGLKQYEISRTVQDNTLHSSFPELEVKIDPSLKYIGNAEHKEKNTSVRTKDEPEDTTASYLFGQLDEQGRLARGLLVRFTVVRGDPYKSPHVDSTQQSKNLLESGVVKIRDDEYNYQLSLRKDFFMDEERVMLHSLTLPSCFMVRQLEKTAGLGGKSTVRIYYFEAFTRDCSRSGCEDCLKTEVNDDEQPKLLQDFTQRSYQSISFLETGKVIDATMKYGIPEHEKPQGSSVSPRQEVPKSSETIEEKLKLLRDLLDKGLITREDYDRKKDEILKGI